MKKDNYEILTEKLMELINDKSKHLKYKDFMRKTMALRNPISGSSYKGGNVMNTIISIMNNDYNSFEFVTFKQAKDNEFKMKKGSKAVPVYFYKKVEKDESDENSREFLIVKRYGVFNLDCFDLTEEQKRKYCQDAKVSKEETKTQNEKIEALKALPVYEVTKVTRAFYVPDSDKIHMPSIENFQDLNHWHEVFFHELTHWTGHESRIDRKLKGKTDSLSYSKEELVAELGSFFICLDMGIDKDIESGASYLKGYLGKTNNKDLFEAMNKAIKAVQFIYNKAGITVDTSD